jgi:pimeloyl-ACP methyl ester carboxylesterase
MPYAQNGPIRIHFETEGSGPALVLHTGAGGDLRIWRDAGYLSGLKEFRVVLIDQRGRGQSTHPREIEAHRIESYAADVEKVLDAVGVESAGFWGYSNGAVVGIAFGAANPKRLKALVGTGTLPFRDYADSPPVADVEAEIRDDVAGGGVRSELEKRMLEEGDRFPDPIDQNVRAGDPLMHALAGISWMAWHGPKSKYREFPAPILMIAGEKEDPRRVTEQSIAAVPDGRLVRLPGIGHLGSFYHSELALPHAVPFLRRHLS